MKLQTASALPPTSASPGKEKACHAKQAGGLSVSFNSVLTDLRLQQGSGQRDANEKSGDLKDPAQEATIKTTSQDDPIVDPVSSPGVGLPSSPDVVGQPGLKSKKEQRTALEPHPLTLEDECRSFEEMITSHPVEVVSEGSTCLDENQPAEQKEQEDRTERDNVDIQFTIIPTESDRKAETTPINLNNSPVIAGQPSESTQSAAQTTEQLTPGKKPGDPAGQDTRSTGSQRSILPGDDSRIAPNRTRSTDFPHSLSRKSTGLPVGGYGEANSEKASLDRAGAVDKLIPQKENRTPRESPIRQQESSLDHVIQDTTPGSQTPVAEQKSTENFKPLDHIIESPPEDSTVPQVGDESLNDSFSLSDKKGIGLRSSPSPANREESLLLPDAASIELTASGEETNSEGDLIKRIRGQSRLSSEGIEPEGIKTSESHAQQKNQSQNNLSSGKDTSDQSPTDDNRLYSTLKESTESFQPELSASIAESNVSEVPEKTIDVPIRSAELGTQRDLDSAQPEAPPLLHRGNAMGLWMRNILQRHEHQFTFENGWNVLKMQLEGNDGAMVVKTRREDDHVSITVGFSDTNIRTLAQAHLGELREALQTLYRNNVEFSLSGDGSGNQDTGRHTKQKERPDRMPDQSSASKTKHSVSVTGNGHEWIG